MYFSEKRFPIFSHIKKAPKILDFRGLLLFFDIWSDYLLDNSERPFFGHFQAFVSYLCFTQIFSARPLLSYYITTVQIVHARILRIDRGLQLF